MHRKVLVFTGRLTHNLDMLLSIELRMFCIFFDPLLTDKHSNQRKKRFAELISSLSQLFNGLTNNEKLHYNNTKVNYELSSDINLLIC